MKTDTRGEWFDDVFAGFTAYYLTSLPVFLAVFFAVDFPSPAGVYSTARHDFVSACVRYDAVHYVQIAQEGYSYDTAQGSVVAFFPAYPLVSRWVSQATGRPAEEAALLTAQVALLGAFIFMVRYVRVRWPEATAEQRNIVLAVFGLWPMGLFFRIPYTESSFVCVTLIFLYSMARGHPLWLLALVAGLGTAVRPVGLALTAAFAWHILKQPGSRFGTKVIRVLLLTPLACWGLLAYMSYQEFAFDAPLAFAQTQQHWTLRAPPERGWMVKLEALATLEPIWNMYVPDSQRYWDRFRFPGSPLFSLYFWNPILFLSAVALLAWGGWKRWLASSELILGAALLAIPYATRAFEMSMASHGRFAAVVVVNYLVLGRMLARSSPLLVAALCTTLALFLFTFTFLYAMNYPIF